MAAVNDLSCFRHPPCPHCLPAAWFPGWWDVLFKSIDVFVCVFLLDMWIQACTTRRWKQVRTDHSFFIFLQRFRVQFHMRWVILEEQTCLKYFTVGCKEELVQLWVFNLFHAQGYFFLDAGRSRPRIKWMKRRVHWHRTCRCIIVPLMCAMFAFMMFFSWNRIYDDWSQHYCLQLHLLVLPLPGLIVEWRWFNCLLQNWLFKLLW